MLGGGKCRNGVLCQTRELCRTRGLCGARGTIQTREWGWTVPNMRAVSNQGAVQSQGTVQNWGIVHKNFSRLRSFFFFLTALACIVCFQERTTQCLGARSKFCFTFTSKLRTCVHSCLCGACSDTGPPIPDSAKQSGCL